MYVDKNIVDIELFAWLEYFQWTDQYERVVI